MSSSDRTFSVLAGLPPLPRKGFLHVSFYFPEYTLKSVANNQVQRAINAADDWLRYADNCWLIWTAETPEQWYRRLAAMDVLKPASILVIRVDLSPSNRAGQFPEWAWEWIGKKRY